MGLPLSTRLYAFDIHQPRIALINQFFSLVGLEPLAKMSDVLVDPPVENTDAAFLFKEAHRMEKREPGCSRSFWLAIRARFLLISLPSVSLHGKFNLTAKHRKLVDAILGANLHIIATMRSKMEYVMDKDSNGKTQIRKVGLQPVQRSGIEYEFTWVIDMDLDHNAIVSKSRASRLADLVEKEPDDKWFQQFYEWLTTGKEPQRTKKELVEFGETLGLKPNDIANALEKSNLQWNSDPSLWHKFTHAVTCYSENCLNK